VQVTLYALLQTREKKLQEPCKISDIALGKKTMFTTQNMISSQDEKCRTSVNKAKYLSLYPWVKMKVWCESRNTLMKTCSTIWYIFGPCLKCSDRNQVCDMQTATKFIPCTHPHYTKQYCGTEWQFSGTNNHVFFVCQYRKLALERSIFDDTMIQE
jgi:hypothetical protein